MIGRPGGTWYACRVTRRDGHVRQVRAADPSVPRVELRKDLRFAIGAGHPWIWRDALMPHHVPIGTDVRVVDREGRFVARALIDAGPIGARVLSWRRDVPIDAALIRSRVDQALALRARIAPPDTDALRLVHGEGDGLPGIVVDRYAHALVVKTDGSAAETILPFVLDALAEHGHETILLRRGRGESKKTEVVRGTRPAGVIEVREHGMVLPVDVVHGQKTGLFLDHRESRRRVRSLASGARVLNLYGYTGGFSIAAGLGGAVHVLTVDIAEAALGLANEGWKRNGLSASAHEVSVGDAPKVLEALRLKDERFDLVIADPPSFAPNEAAVPEAVRSYRALHRACLRLLTPRGLYLAASCSSHVRREAFDRTLLDAAEKASSVLQVIERWGAPADHPQLAAFPEGEYLKCTLARVIS